MREAVVTLWNVHALARKHHLAAIVLIDVDEANAVRRKFSDVCAPCLRIGEYENSAVTDTERCAERCSGEIQEIT